jgi:hypothetical protein
LLEEKDTMMKKWRFFFFIFIPLLIIDYLFLHNWIAENLSETLAVGFSGVLVTLLFASFFYEAVKLIWIGFAPGIFLGNGRESRRILKFGKPAVAKILEIGESSEGGVITINEQPYLGIKLEIDDGKKTPYAVSFDTLIPRSAVPQFQPGAAFAVKIDPNDPQKVVLDTSGEEIKEYEGWSEKEVKEAKKGKAKVLEIRDTGRSENFKPVVKVTWEVIPQRGSLYTYTREYVFPTSTVQALKSSKGKAHTCKINPNDPYKIIVSLK